MDDVITDVEKSFGGGWPESRWRDVTVLVAVSGGADSVGLLRLLHRQIRTGRGKLVVGHVNHQLRGTQSNEDQQWVQDLCRRLELPLLVRRVNAPDAGKDASACGESNHADDSPLFQRGARGVGDDSNQGQTSEDSPLLQRGARGVGGESNQGQGPESRWRTARYELLLEMARESGARFLATAHTKDDQVETVLFRIIRGTGLDGLCGIPSVRVIDRGLTLVRPLLGLWRKDIEAYLQALDQPFLSDPSNLSTEFSRNRIRLELLPLLRREYNASVDEALLRLSSLGAETRAEIGAIAQREFDRCVRCCDSQTLTLSCAALAELGSPIATAVLRLAWRKQNWPQRDMTLEKWQCLTKIATSQSRNRQAATFPGSVQVIKQGSDMILSRPSGIPTTGPKSSCEDFDAR